jgi:hypothetical protein
MIPWIESWEEARAQAAASGRLLYLFLHSPS